MALPRHEDREPDARTRLLGGRVFDHSTCDGTTGPVDNSSRGFLVTRSDMGPACGGRGLVVVGHPHTFGSALRGGRKSGCFPSPRPVAHPPDRWGGYCGEAADYAAAAFIVSR